MSANGSKSIVEVGAKELQGPGVVFCPNPKMPPFALRSLAASSMTVSFLVGVLMDLRRA